MKPYRKTQRPWLPAWDHRLKVTLRPFTGADDLLPRLYVSPDLHHLVVESSLACLWGNDVTMPGDDGVLRTYRRLDLGWLTWIGRRVAAAQAKATPTVREQYAARFALVRAWAIDRWSTAAERALTTLPDARYRAPAVAA